MVRTWTGLDFLGKGQDPGDQGELMKVERATSGRKQLLGSGSRGMRLVISFSLVLNLLESSCTEVD